MLAAYLWAQFERASDIQARRRQIWHRYAGGLSTWAEEQNVELPSVPANLEQSFHIFYLLLPSLKARAALIAYLKRRDILSVFHYQPLHLSSMGQRFGGKPGDCPVTEDVADRLLRCRSITISVLLNKTKSFRLCPTFSSTKIWINIGGRF